MKWIILLITVLFMTACQEGSYKPSAKQKLSDKILNNVAAQLQKKIKGLHPCGTGGQMMDQIKMLALSFDYFGPMDIEKGREILLIVVNEFIETINADENIRPYLNNFPFEPKNIQIRIFLRKKDGSDPDLGELSIITSMNGFLEYEIDDPETTLFTSIYKETYEESVHKVKEEHVSQKK